VTGGRLVREGVHVAEGVKDGVNVIVFVGGGRKAVADEVRVTVAVGVKVDVGVFVIV